jgi:hypothetical protein
MRTTTRSVLLLFSLFLVGQVDVWCQWNTGISGNQYLTAPTDGVAVGTTTATPPSALTVNGGQMTPSTGEVFRTFSNGLADTYWRMHKSSLEVGNIHALNNTSEHWYLNAVPGDLRFQTATTDRGMFNRVLVGQTIGSAMGLDLTGYFGVGAFSGGSFTRAASKVHIDRNGLNTGGYRAFMGEGLLATSGGGLLYAGMFGTAGTDLGLAWSSGSAPFRFVNTTAGGTSGREMGHRQPDGALLSKCEVAVEHRQAKLAYS